MLEILNIEPTKTTLGVRFNPQTNVLEFVGTSYPTNPITFFQPIIEWVRNYLAQEQVPDIILEFRLKYFNTSSSTCVFKMLELFDAAYKQHKNVKVIWYYMNDDEDSLESWKSLFSDLDLPYHIIEES